MKTYFIIPFLFFIGHLCAQEKSESQVTDLIKVNFLTPGINYEKKVGKSQTLVALAYLNTAILIGASSAQGIRSNVFIDPAVQLQYRFYYNYQKRQEKVKRTALNSLNYISPTFQFVFSDRRTSSEYFFESKRRAMNTIGAVWGFQRNYNNRLSLDFNIGLGYLFTTATTINNSELIRINVGQISPMSQLTLGFWLNKRQ